MEPNNSLQTDPNPEISELSFISPSGMVDETRFMRHFHPSAYKKGQMVFHQDSYPFGIFYLLSGRVKISRITPDGKEKIIRIALPGQFLGYADLLAGHPYTTSTETLENSSLIFMPQDKFLKMIQENPHAALKFMQLLCVELGEIENRLTEMAFVPVRGRLAETLLRLEKIYNPEKCPKFGGIELSRTDLANLVGTAKETVARFISEFKAEGLIKTDGRKIILLNQNALKNLVQQFE
ncbi:MAG: Crp/Fnr family transcriptional regulator [Bacteroidia bacterium]|nr:Crp/Fnr family transcriptional regulator [Bacteroidia bacterium]